MSYDINWLPKKVINEKYVSELLQTSLELGQFTNNGPNVKRLEEKIKNLLQIEDKAVICVSNGSTALHALTAGIDIEYNKKLYWATQSFTFPSSAQGYLHDANIIDIDMDGGLDLNLLHNNTDGIIVTNVFGNLVDIDKYVVWAKENNKILIFDNAATPYSFYKGKNSLNYGTASTISFHHTKPLGFGEGGAIIVDKKYEKSIRRIMNFGIDENHGWHPIGSNYKMSDISAVYILQYLENFNEIVEKTQENYKLYKELLADTDIKFYSNFSDEDNTSLCSCICLLHKSFTKDKVKNILDKKIFCRKYYNPLIPYNITNKIYSEIICFPCHYKMTKDDVKYVVDIIKST